MKITSLTNPRIKYMVSLRKKKSIEHIIVEGAREIQRALETRIGCLQVFISEGFDAEVWEWPKGCDVFILSKNVFEKISFGKARDGIIALFARPEAGLQRISKKTQLVVVVESVEKPGNLGAILRSCDGAGVDAVLVGDPKVDIYNPHVIRASLGAVFSVPVAVATNEDIFVFLQEKKIRTFAAAPEAKKRYDQCDLTGNLAIVLGSEQDGLSAFWKSKADCKMAIPMNGRVDSLNVSASAAVLLYEAVRQKMKVRCNA